MSCNEYSIKKYLNPSSWEQRLRFLSDSLTFKWPGVFANHYYFCRLLPIRHDEQTLLKLLVRTCSLKMLVKQIDMLQTQYHSLKSFIVQKN